MLLIDGAFVAVLLSACAASSTRSTSTMRPAALKPVAAGCASGEIFCCCTPPATRPSLKTAIAVRAALAVVLGAADRKPGTGLPPAAATLLAAEGGRGVAAPWLVTAAPVLGGGSWEVTPKATCAAELCTRNWFPQSVRLEQQCKHPQVQCINARSCCDIGYGHDIARLLHS